MARFQDLREFEDKIEEAVNEWISDQEGYDEDEIDYGFIRIFRDEDGRYDAELTYHMENDGADYYNVEKYVYEGEPDFDETSDLASNYIFVR